MTTQRYISETGQEQRIAAIVTPVAKDLGFSLVRVKILPENGCTLQIMAEDDFGRFTVAQCQELSQELSPVLDVEEPIDVAYHLEVSSPGVDRPLVRVRDFENCLGHEVRIELATMLDGRKRFRGLVKSVDASNVIVTLPDVPAGANADFALPLKSIATAKLILTDRLLKEAADQQKNDTTLDDQSVHQITENPTNTQMTDSTNPTNSKETN